jgi:two-component system, LytTR family, sensor histidine kinase AlgZ
MINRVLWGNVTVGRALMHVLFWTVVFVIFSVVYAIQSNYLIAIRNNLFYVPVHTAYFYIVAYWLIPRYLFAGRYFWAATYVVTLAFVVAVICRVIDLWITAPYMIAHLPDIDPDYVSENKLPHIERLANPHAFVSALKMSNQVIWFAVGIKLFKHWYERKQAALQAELNALKGQVHPHFLFNTLNNLYALTLNNSPKSPQVVLGLSDLLRYMLYECNTEKVALKQELQMLKQYVELEKLRFEDRLDLSFNIEGDASNKLVAPLMMLPLVENAFKHGASQIIGDAWININVRIAGNEMKFKISNSKTGDTAATGGLHFGNIGLTNLRKRLDLLYPGVHKLKILDDEDTFLAILELKLNTVPQTAAIPVIA